MAIAYINATRRRGKRQRGGGIAQPRQGGDTVMATAYRTTLPRRALVSGVGWWQLTAFAAIIVGRNNPINVATPSCVNMNRAANNHKRSSSNGSFC